MTRIKYRTRPVWHETGLLMSGRAICVAESPVNLLIRLKGTRQVMQLPWSMALLRAATIKAMEVQREKAAARKQRRVIRDRMAVR